MDRPYSMSGVRGSRASHESLPSTPYIPQGVLSTPEQDTSSKLAEPKSELLRNILRDKRAGRRTSPAPRRPSMSSSRSSYADEWTAVPESETPIPRRVTPRRRPHHARRASVADVPTRTPAPAKNMTVKETNDLITKLQNENFDVKLRLTLTQERVVKLENDVQTVTARAERVEQLEERNTELEDQVTQLKERLDALTKEKDGLEDQHQEHLSINEALVKELEQRDSQLQERDVAVEEAATLIDQLQGQVRRQKITGRSPRSPTIRHQSSDYFSSEAGSHGASKPSPNSSSLDISASRPSTAPGSDYYSVGSSPRLNARCTTPRPLSRRQASISRALQFSPSSNKSTTSIPITPDATHLPPLPEPSTTTTDTRQALDLMASAHRVRRPLVLRTNTTTISTTPPRAIRQTPSRVAAIMATNAPLPPPHKTLNEPTRPLRNLYMSGELNRRIDTTNTKPSPSSSSDIPPPVPLHRDFSGTTMASSRQASLSSSNGSPISVDGQLDTQQYRSRSLSFSSSPPTTRRNSHSAHARRPSTATDETAQRSPASETSGVSCVSDSTVSMHPNMGFGGSFGSGNKRGEDAYGGFGLGVGFGNFGLGGLSGLKQAPVYPPWPVTNGMLARDFLFNPLVDGDGGDGRRGARRRSDA